MLVNKHSGVVIFCEFDLERSFESFEGGGDVPPGVFSRNGLIHNGFLDHPLLVSSLCRYSRKVNLVRCWDTHRSNRGGDSISRGIMMLCCLGVVIRPYNVGSSTMKYAQTNNATGSLSLGGMANRDPSVVHCLAGVRSKSDSVTKAECVRHTCPA